MRLAACSWAMSASIGVSITAGATQLTRIRAPAMSFPIDFAIVMTSAFDAEWPCHRAALDGSVLRDLSGGRAPSTDPMAVGRVMLDPLPVA